MEDRKSRTRVGGDGCKARERGGEAEKGDG
jgi:hypothetical protein